MIFKLCKCYEWQQSQLSWGCKAMLFRRHVGCVLNENNEASICAIIRQAGKRSQDIEPMGLCSNKELVLDSHCYWYDPHPLQTVAKCHYNTQKCLHLQQTRRECTVIVHHCLTPQEVKWYISIYQFPMCNGPDSSSSEFCSSFTSLCHLLLVQKSANQPTTVNSSLSALTLFFQLLLASPSNIY